jgi:phage-related protein
MASNIDVTKPTTVNPTLSSVRANFATIKAEIEALQSSIGSSTQQTRTQAQATSAVNWANGDTLIISTASSAFAIATPTNAIAGRTYTIIVVQNATGGWDYEFNNVLYAGGAPNQKQKIQLYYDGVDYI